MDIFPPFQSHSETSIAAAEKVKSKVPSQKDNILYWISIFGNYGMTGAELSSKLDMQTGTVSARLRELQSDGLIRKSPDIRQGGNVWKLPHFVPIEAEKKRDKSAEALQYIDRQLSDGDISYETESHLEALYRILK